jgi:hypothetical protein
MLEATKASLPEDLKLQVHVKGRNEDGAAQMAALLAALKESSGATPAVGWLPKEKPEGDLMTRWGTPRREILRRPRSAISCKQHGVVGMSNMLE